MKKFLVLMLTGIMVLIFSGIVSAGVYEYRPWYNGDDDLDDLDHNYAYAWGINLNAADQGGNVMDLTSETIVGASLYFGNICDWTRETNTLYVSLLDEPSTGVTRAYDNEASGNLFDTYPNTKELLRIDNMDTDKRYLSIDITNSPVTSADTYGYTVYPNYDVDNSTITIQQNSLSSLIAYASNGIFGLGFDPDCHYYNDSIRLKLLTAEKGDVVPEPATLMLFGIGLLGFAGRMRKKMKQA